jgi:hypothetical protein
MVADGAEHGFRPAQEARDQDLIVSGQTRVARFLKELRKKQIVDLANDLSRSTASGGWRRFAACRLRT